MLHTRSFPPSELNCALLFPLISVCLLTIASGYMTALDAKLFTWEVRTWHSPAAAAAACHRAHWELRKVLWFWEAPKPFTKYHTCLLLILVWGESREKHSDKSLPMFIISCTSEQAAAAHPFALNISLFYSDSSLWRFSLDTLQQEEDKPLHFWVTALPRERDLSICASFQPVSFTITNPVVVCGLFHTFVLICFSIFLFFLLLFSYLLGQRMKLWWPADSLGGYLVASCVQGLTVICI